MKRIARVRVDQWAMKQELYCRVVVKTGRKLEKKYAVAKKTQLLLIIKMVIMIYYTVY